MTDVLAVRNGLQALIERAPAGGLFHAAEMEAAARNAFCLSLGPGEQIVTVTITVGGAIRRSS